MTDDPKFEWLDGTQTLFSVSKKNALNVDTAYEHNLELYAHGYRRSAEMLFEALKKSNSYADSQFFALAFLWRQALELHLKSLHNDLDQLEGVCRRIGPMRAYNSTKHHHLAPPLTGHDLNGSGRI